MIDVLNVSVQGIPLFFVVFVLVELLKRIEDNNGEPALRGNALLFSSFAIGLLVGIGYFAYNQPPEAAYQYWFGAGVFGVAIGGVASIFYDALKIVIDRLIGARLGE